MNYNLLKVLPLSMIIVLTISFFSCCEDEKDIIDPEGSKDIITEEKPDEGLNANCVLISVTEECRYPSNLTITTEIFHSPIYEINSWNGRTILKSYKKEGDLFYSLVCDLPDYVFLSTPNYEMECELNIRGLISEAKIERETHSFKYDNKNRLIEKTMQYGSEVQLEKFTYDDKYNMIGYKRTRDEEVLCEAQIEYSTIQAKAIPLQSLYGNVFGDIFNNVWPLLEMGLYGNSIPLYLVNRIVYKKAGEDVETVYEYTLDKNGYVIKMVEMDYRVSGTYITTYTFEWGAISTLSYTNWLFTDIGSPYYRYL